MPITKLRNIPHTIGAIVLYVPSASMQLYLKNILKEKFQVLKEYSVEIDNKQKLHDSKLEGLNKPLFCDKWLYHVDADKFTGKKDLIEEFTRISDSAVTIYWTTKYKIYKNLTNQSVFEKQPLNYVAMTFSRLEDYEITELIKQVQPDEKKRLKQSLITFVKKNYRYEVQSVFDLLANLKSGVEFETERDIVKTIGLGGNSADSLVVSLLSKDFEKTVQATKAFKQYVNQLEDLYEEFTPQSIRAFMLNTVNIIIEIKQLEIMGIYGKINREIPDYFHVDKIKRLRRYERTILEEISLPRALFFRQIMLEFNNFDTRISNIQVISRYMDLYHMIPSPPRKKTKTEQAKEQAEKEKEMVIILAEKKKAIEEGAERTRQVYKAELARGTQEEDTNTSKDDGNQSEVDPFDILMSMATDIPDTLFTKVKTLEERQAEYLAREEEKRREQEEEEGKNKKGRKKESKTNNNQSKNSHLDEVFGVTNDPKVPKVPKNARWISDTSYVDENGEIFEVPVGTRKRFQSKLAQHKSDASTDALPKKPIMDEEGVIPKFIDDEPILDEPKSTKNHSKGKTSSTKQTNTQDQKANLLALQRMIYNQNNPLT